MISHLCVDAGDFGSARFVSDPRGIPLTLTLDQKIMALGMDVKQARIVTRKDSFARSLTLGRR